jgi:hypothetical protein
MHYYYEDLLIEAQRTPRPHHGPWETTITMFKGDTAYAPGTTKYWIGTAKGARITYRFYTDGGCETEVLEGSVFRTERPVAERAL